MAITPLSQKQARVIAGVIVVVIIGVVIFTLYHLGLLRSRADTQSRTIASTARIYYCNEGDTNGCSPDDNQYTLSGTSNTVTIAIQTQTAPVEGSVGEPLEPTTEEVQPGTGSQETEPDDEEDLPDGQGGPTTEEDNEPAPQNDSDSPTNTNNTSNNAQPDQTADTASVNSSASALTQDISTSSKQTAPSTKNQPATKKTTAAPEDRRIASIPSSPPTAAKPTSQAQPGSAVAVVAPPAPDDSVSSSTAPALEKATQNAKQSPPKKLSFWQRILAGLVVIKDWFVGILAP